ncbi:MAG: hybrid-cluster NAD(P)-dependent oxidoreductase [Pseudomonadota bacterium]|uniref:hybrid-cluster NAD(P)-dependent oxidoreductase n=1 Tax=Phenylobacterium sp. TaxID=1871053 RepID=UPI0025E9FB03|nr:hybrid-cluster NAD(P)-dependent oxidoreductase [Phenylobacterium sp.]MBT9470590.1 hybrid-cluster NAD(P)-dependent oxidoreductase [Phenylobacterium sp.]
MSVQAILARPAGTPPPAWDAEVDDVLICRAVHDETHDVRTFVFSAPEPRLFHFRPGQFLTFEFQIGGESVHRCYTLASSPTRPNTIAITVKRVPGGPVSNWLHDTLKVGGAIRALGPMGEFTCADHPAAKYLFLSAGSGVTPLMSMARAHHDLASDADIVFIHSARSPADIVFRDEVALMERVRSGFRAAAICETAGDGWAGLTGRLGQQQLDQLAPDFREREIFVCGPAGYMEAAKAMLVAAGFDMTRHHEESFDFATLNAAEPELAEPAAASTETQYTISFANSGRTVTCGPDTFVLDAARAAGMRLPSSCTKGMCGTCKSKMVAGAVNMTHAGGIRQREIDQGMILLCCSRPTSDLIIER